MRLKPIVISFVLTFAQPGFTAAKYDETIKQLEAAGAAAPKGRSYYVSYGDPENLHVTDIWDNMEDVQAFGENLLPILASLGFDRATKSRGSTQYNYRLDSSISGCRLSTLTPVLFRIFLQA